MSRNLKIVGFDPSYRNWGVVIGSVPLDSGILTVHELHTIKTTPIPKSSKVRKSTYDISQATILSNGVLAAIKDADIICVEVPYGSQDAKSAVGRGVCLGILGLLPPEKTIFVTPQSVKKIIGSPTATKAESIRWSVKTHPEAPWPKYRNRVTISGAEHVSDALVAIYAAAQTKEFKSLIQEYKHASSNQKTT